ncbi:MAG: hypothetical protein NTNFB02_01790 [Nitrospira sp.]
MKCHRLKVFIVCAILLGTSELANAACNQTLSPGANLASAISSAAAGTTICLNSGSYGSVTLGSFTKSPRVIVQATTPLGPTMGLSAQSGANGVTFDGISFTSGATISGSLTKNITIQNSDFGTRQLAISTVNFNNNNILIDHNTFGAHNATGCEGRLCITWGGGPGSVPAGVVVSNNTFGPGGCSDGIQVGSYGVVIGPGNTFTGIVQGNCAAHVDAIQGYGQSHTTVTGNYFTNNTVDLGFYDGGASEVFTHNVLEHSSSNGVAVQCGTISNPLYEHNTMKNAGVNFNGKPENGNTTNLLLRNNIFLGSSRVNLTQNGTPACTNCTVTNNLFDTSNIASGSNNLIGTPTFVGGSSPNTWTAYQLSSASLGKNAGSDGKDMGINGSGTDTDAIPPSPPTNLRVQ